MGHIFTTRKYRGEDPYVHKPRTVYELLDNGKVIYTLYYPLTEAGEDHPQGKKTFEEQCNKRIDAILATSESKEIN